MRGRAVIANPDYFLTPGMFGNMRLAAGGAHEALLVPDSAVQTDQARKVVYVVGKGDLVDVRPVQTGPLVDGLRVIHAGLTATDRVVIQGIQYAQPGSPVASRWGKITALAPARSEERRGGKEG